MTPTARDLIEAGAIYMAAYWHNPWETMEPEPKAMYLAANRAALIATFRKLAEDGPTEAMIERVQIACALVLGKSATTELLRAAFSELLRELEELTL